MSDYVLVTRKFFPETIDFLKEKFNVFDNQKDISFDRGQLIDYMRDAIGAQISTSEIVDSDLLDRCKKLRVISNTAVGYDNIDIKACTERGVIVTNTPGVLDETVADYAMGLTIAACRQIPRYEMYLRERKWEKSPFTGLLSRDVNGSVFGFMGFGRIGQAIARRAISFRGSVLYHTRNALPRSVEERLSATFVSKQELLEKSDIIILILPHNPETHHFIGEQELSLMKKDAVLVNMARGGIVGDTALVEALEKGSIFSAGLDVYENEPDINPDFFRLRNVVLSPHLGSATIKTRKAMAMKAAVNLAKALDGETPPDLVNPGCLA